MRNDFCVFVLSHGRPDRVYTFKTIRAAGYTGKVYIVIDDEDRTSEQYRGRFGDSVLTFCKSEIAATFDEGDNFDDRRAIFYARNACQRLAKDVGVRYFIQLDDDYTGFYYRRNSGGTYGSYRIKSTMDLLFEAMLDYYEEIPALSVAISQGGDWIGGDTHKSRLKRKVMNSFICSTSRPFVFLGRVNEDVNTYTTLGRCGALFLTVQDAQLNQRQTQSNAGGMTDLYLDSGTYLKSFYSVMYAPSCVRIGTLQDPRSPHCRIHHDIDWPRTAACILREKHKKVTRGGID